VRFAPFSEPDPFKEILGPSFAGKRPKTDQHFNLYFSFLLRPLVGIVPVPVPAGRPHLNQTARRCRQGRRGQGLVDPCPRSWWYGGSPCCRRPWRHPTVSAGYLKAVWPEICGSVFGRFSAKLSPQNPSRTTGLVLQCRLHQQSAPQTNSKAISWHQQIPARLPSGTQHRDPIVFFWPSVFLEAWGTKAKKTNFFRKV
jgi:hypothetical protein